MNCSVCGKPLLLNRVAFKCSCGAYVHAYCLDQHILEAHRPEVEEGYVDLNSDFHPINVPEPEAEIEEASVIEGFELPEESESGDGVSVESAGEVEAEGAADGESVAAHRHLVGGSEGHGSHARRLHPQQREVVGGVGGQQLDLADLSAVLEANEGRSGTARHVVVGDDETVVGDEEAAAMPLALLHAQLTEELRLQLVAPLP